jgi:D-arabinose 1-dehydrogenase-like Zn-dependent alcohol dehydrogenase
MRAAVVRGFGQPLIIEERPVPEVGPGQVVVRMEASGLCHTDIHAASGDWPVKPTVPFIPGHADLADVFGLHAAGRTRGSYETRPLAEVNDAIDEVVHGKAKGRIVLEP